MSFSLLAVPKTPSGLACSDAPPQQQTCCSCEKAAKCDPVKTDPAGGLLDFKAFFLLLDNVDQCNNVVQQRNGFLDGCAYKKAEELYQEGVKKLLGVRFLTSDDAMNSFKIVLKRAFRGLSTESKDSKTALAQRVVCSKTKAKEKNKRKHVQAMVLCFGEDERLFSSRCKWKATLVNSKDEKPGFYFTSVSSLHDHALSCFTDCGYMPRELTKLVSSCSTYIDRLSLNKTICKKMGYAVDNGAVYMHKYNRKTTEAERETKSYIRHLNEADLAKLSMCTDDDKAVIGACRSFEKEDKGFVFKYETMGTKLDFIAVLWPSQIEKLKYHGDLVFIDSTFGVSTKKFKALNVVVVDQHFKSVLAATAFTSSEWVTDYKALLQFIEENVNTEDFPFAWSQMQPHKYIQQWLRYTLIADTSTVHSTCAKMKSHLGRGRGAQLMVSHLQATQNRM